MLNFNSAPSTIMHIDFNSCFASIEQQANPFLRGKPIVVAAYATDRGCILAASREAKIFGIKTGMWVREGREKYPKLIVLQPDPWKYRNVHLKLRSLVSDYTSDFSPKSIDEFVLNMNGFPKLKQMTMAHIALEIKKRIKQEIGDWLTVSVGIAPNKYLAKIGAGLKKPDGLEEINIKNFLKVYSKLKLTDLTGIKERNAARLNSMGIYSVLDFYRAPVWRVRAAFHSITGLYWHTRLAGYEVDNVEYGRRSYGNSTAIGKNIWRICDLSPILARLTEKMSARLRNAGYKARGIHLAIIYKSKGQDNSNEYGGNWNGQYKGESSWHKGRLLSKSQFDARDFFRAAARLLFEAKPDRPVLNLAVSCFGLSKEKSLQLEFFDDAVKKEKIIKSLDTVNEKWGDFTVGMARGINGSRVVLDRIAFGGVKELEEFTNKIVN